MADPWAHRSTEMKCRTCIWFVVKKTEAELTAKGKELSIEDEPLIVVGRCRRHAPTMSGYPVVFEMDWCGDHKLDENKI